MGVTINDLIEKVKEYNYNEKDFRLIRNAYEFAKKSHGSQKRASGEEFIQHPLAVAYILAEKRMDHETICAALLHDVIEDSNVRIEQLRKVCNNDDDVIKIVEGVTKTEKIHFSTKEDYKAENLRKVLLATSKDSRVIILKLADRLDNMRTLDSFPEYKQKRIAQETMEIFAPIAHKLGMWNIKGELEDLSLRYNNPNVYSELKNKINEKRKEREKKTKEIVVDISTKLDKLNIDAQVTGRAKYFFSIYKKMTDKKRTFDEINDLVALRIITKTVSDCYFILELAKKLYVPIKDRFKDYIKNPKKNGYQSLHIDVITKDKRILELQIRTLEMHHQAEEGVAAHWQYKQTERDKKFDRKIGWLKQILEWKAETESKEFLENLKIDLFQDEIVVLTPKSDPIILPEDSTPIDFAYSVHTNIGDTCSKAEINNKLVPLNYKLKSGDICRVITQKNSKPHRSWLKFVKTGKAKSKIRSKLGIMIEKDTKSLRLMQEMKNIEINLLKYLDYNGKRNIKLSKCCNPQLNDLIEAYLTKDGTITVHKKSCPNTAGFEKNKKVLINWKKEDKSIKTIVISVKDKIGLIRDILDEAMNSNVSIFSVNIKTIKTNILITLKIKCENKDSLKQLMENLSNNKAVYSIKIQK